MISKNEALDLYVSWLASLGPPPTDHREEEVESFDRLTRQWLASLSRDQRRGVRRYIFDGPRAGDLFK